MQFPPLLIIAGLSLFVSGCESWRFAAPVSDLSMRTPGSWTAASSGAEGRISSGWLSEFSDADLTRTVDQALAHNRDLKAAATRLRVAEENTIIARSRMLPSAGLSGSAFHPADHKGGAVSAEARAALARNEGLIHNYAQAALEAFREVESTLAADRSLAAQEKFLASELEQAALAEKQAERDYSEGINPNILSVLEAQRRANNARASMIRLQNQRLQNRIDLHLALGGDFTTRA